MKFNHHNSGYSMIEVLVAISVLLLAVIGPMSIAARSLQQAQLSSQQNAAFFLAQEGIEAAYKLRADAGWDHLNNPGSSGSWDWTSDAAFSDCFTANGCGIDWRDLSLSNNVVSCGGTACQLYYNSSASRARYSHQSSGDDTIFTRVINFEATSATELRVRSTVSWIPPGRSTTREVTLESYMHDIYDTTP